MVQTWPWASVTERANESQNEEDAILFVEYLLSYAKKKEQTGNHPEAFKSWTTFNFAQEMALSMHMGIYMAY